MYLCSTFIYYKTMCMRALREPADVAHSQYLRMCTRRSTGSHGAPLEILHGIVNVVVTVVSPLLPLIGMV